MKPVLGGVALVHGTSWKHGGGVHQSMGVQVRPSPCVPVGHAVHALLDTEPGGQYVWNGHDRQKNGSLAPCSGLYVELLQFVQFDKATAPTCVEYVPAGHSWQNDESVAPYWLLYLPASHAVQVESAEAPDTLLYVPCGHSMHTVSVVANGVGL